MSRRRRDANTRLSYTAKLSLITIITSLLFYANPCTAKDNTVEGVAPVIKWNPPNLITEIVERPDPVFFGSFDFIDNGEYFNQFRGWSFTITPKDDGSVSIVINEGPEDGGAKYQAKIVKVSKYEIIFVHRPVTHGLEEMKLVVSKENSRIDAMSLDVESGDWLHENCWIKRK